MHRERKLGRGSWSGKTPCTESSVGRRSGTLPDSDIQSGTHRTLRRWDKLVVGSREYNCKVSGKTWSRTRPRSFGAYSSDRRVIPVRH